MRANAKMVKIVFTCMWCYINLFLLLWHLVFFLHNRKMKREVSSDRLSLLLRTFMIEDMLIVTLNL